MIQRPVFSAAFTVTQLPGEGVLLASECERIELRGTLYERLSPLLDGIRSPEDIVAALSGEFPGAHVYYALLSLERRHCLVDAAHCAVESEDAFWQPLGLTPHLARAALESRTASVVAFGVDAQPALAALGRAGVRIAPRDGDIQVVLCADFLDASLVELNTEALACDRVWLLARTIGVHTWLGPLFVPGATACWECMAHALRSNRRFEVLVDASAAGRLRTSAVASVPFAGEMAAATVAAHVSRWLAGDVASPLRGTLHVHDFVDGSTTIHPVRRRPQCTACGDPLAYAAVVSQPVVLESAGARRSADAGDRRQTAEAVVTRLMKLVSPLTGVARGLEAMPVIGAPSIHAYASGPNPARSTITLRQLRSDLRAQNSGKGMSDMQARASALGESVERASATWHGDEPHISATRKSLGDLAISPNDCMLFSAAQYARRSARGGPGGLVWPTDFVPAPFDADAECEWTPVWSLTRQQHRYLPTAYLYLGCPSAGDCTVIADSNGVAAGSCLEDAVMQGLMETIERDGAAIWWYNRIQRPAVHYHELLGPDEREYVRRLATEYRVLGREFWVLDLTTDLGVPTCAAITRRVDAPSEEILMGLSAHLDPVVAIVRAITEMNQMVAGLASFGGNDVEMAPEIAWWLREARVAELPHLLPGAEHGARPRQWVVGDGSTARDQITECRAMLEAKGLEVLVLNQTRPDLELSVARTIVPGLRFFWPRFAPGRLYDVPVRMGWRAAPIREEDLNPVPFFL